MLWEDQDFKLSFLKKMVSKKKQDSRTIWKKKNLPAQQLWEDLD